MKDEKSKITAVAIEKMIDFYQGNLRDIEHFLKVWAYAKTIGEQESVDENTQGRIIKSIILENNLWHNQNRMNYTKHCNRKAIRTAFAGKLLINR